MWSSRAGLAPVVASLVLVLIVIVAGGGTYAWFTSVVAEEQAVADRALNTELRMRDVVCDRGAVKIGVSNTGSQGIDTATADLFVYRVSDGNLVASRSGIDLSDLSLDPGDFTTIPLFTRNVLGLNTEHRVELRFPDSDAAVTGTCTANAGSLAAGLWPLNGGGGNTTEDVAGGATGNLSGRLLDDWEDGDMAGWTLGCGGAPSSGFTSGYRSDTALWLNSTGGDGLACINRASNDYDAVAGTTIRFACRGYGCRINVWNGSENLAVGDGTNNHGDVPDWTVYKATVDTTESGIDFFFYNNDTTGFYGIYDTISEGPLPAEGRAGNALSMDGVDDAVQISSQSSVSGVDPGTYMFWFKPADNLTGGTANGWGMLGKLNEFEIGNIASHGDGSSLAMGIWGDRLATAKTSWDAGTWYHVVFVVDSANNIFKVYVDGTLDNEKTPGVSIASTGDDLNIGLNADHSAYFNGTIDEVQIYPTALR